MILLHEKQRDEKEKTWNDYLRHIPDHESKTVVAISELTIAIRELTKVLHEKQDGDVDE